MPADTSSRFDDPEITAVAWWSIGGDLILSATFAVIAVVWIRHWPVLSVAAFAVISALHHVFYRSAIPVCARATAGGLIVSAPVGPDLLIPWNEIRLSRGRIVSRLARWGEPLSRALRLELFGRQSSLEEGLGRTCTVILQSNRRRWPAIRGRVALVFADVHAADRAAALLFERLHQVPYRFAQNPNRRPNES